MPEQPPDKDSGLEGLLEKDEESDSKPDFLGQILADFEEKTSDLEKKLYEERFIWALTLVIAVDVFVFSNMDNWAGSIIIGIFELIAIVILADRCNVKTVMPIIDKLTGFTNNFTKGSGN